MFPCFCVPMASIRMRHIIRIFSKHLFSIVSYIGQVAGCIPLVRPLPSSIPLPSFVQSIQAVGGGCQHNRRHRPSPPPSRTRVCHLFSRLTISFLPSSDADKKFRKLGKTNLDTKTHGVLFQQGNIKVSKINHKLI